MRNRMKPLLATYYVNIGAVGEISSDRIKSSGIYEQMRKLEGREFARKWRSAEMQIALDQQTARLIGHHIFLGKERLNTLLKPIEQELAKKGEFEMYPYKTRSSFVRKLPENLLDRLQPVFEQSNLFDPELEFQKRFDEWRKSYISQLDTAKTETKKGPGYEKRLFNGYKAILHRQLPVLEALFGDLVELLAEAGYLEANLNKHFS